MLRRIIAIRNVGRFKNSAYAPNPGWAKNTVVFAPNGFGKTTLCSILRSLQSNDPAIVLGHQTIGAPNAPDIDLLFNDGNRRFQHGAWNSPEPRVSFFDSGFISENVHSGDVVDVNNKRKLYRIIVGEAGVGLARQEQELAEQARAKQGQLSDAQRLVQRFVPTGIRLAEFLALVQDNDIDAKVANQKKLIEGLEQAESIRTHASLSELPRPDLEEDLAQLLNRNLESVADDIEARITSHLDKHGMQEDGQKWLSDGLKYAAQDECPFCGQTGLEQLPLIHAYRTLFSDGYRQIQSDAQDTRERVTNALGVRARARLETLVAQNQSSFDFWQRHCRIDAPLPSIDEALTTLESAEASFLEILDRKIQAPLESMGADERLAAGEERAVRGSEVIDAYNTVVQGTNELIIEKKRITDAAELLTASAELQRLGASKHRYEPAVAAACDQHETLVAEKAALERQKAEVRERLETHSRDVVQPYENRINEFLGLFNAGFRISRTGHGYPGGIATSSYQLSINNTDVDLGDDRTPVSRPSFKNTLSAGDRTTLALAFFLAGLESKANLADQIVVFDDPFGSQDAFRRRQTIYEILRVAEGCAQVVVFSHDPAFLKQVWDKLDPASRGSLQIVYHRSIGSKIADFDIDDAVRGRARAELDDLMAFRSTGAGVLREIIKKLRIVLESHFRSTYPGSFEPQDNCGAILQKIRLGGEHHPAHGDYEILNRINDYTSDYHHGEGPRGEAEPLLDQVELSGFVDQTLRLVNMIA